MVVEPLPGDPLELTEQVQLRLLAGVAPLRLQQPLRQVEQQGRLPQVAGVDQVQIDPFADDALDARDGTGPTSAGVSSSVESSLRRAVKRSSGSTTR